MDFKTTLKHLGKLGEVNFEEFAEATDIPKHNASVYLSRLFKMGLVSRRKDKRHDKDPRTYRYRVSEKKGNRYLKYEETTKTEIKQLDDEKLRREYLRDKLRYYRLLRALKKEITKTKFEKIPCVVNGFLHLLTPAEFREWTELKEEQRIAEKWDKYW